MVQFKSFIYTDAQDATSGSTRYTLSLSFRHLSRFWSWFTCNRESTAEVFVLCTRPTADATSCLSTCCLISDSYCSSWKQAVNKSNMCAEKMEPLGLPLYDFFPPQVFEQWIVAFHESCRTTSKKICVGRKWIRPSFALELCKRTNTFTVQSVRCALFCSAVCIQLLLGRLIQGTVLLYRTQWVKKRWCHVRSSMPFMTLRRPTPFGLIWSLP